MVTLTNVGTSYDTTTAAKGLGFAEIDFSGVTSVVFTVRYNKVGSGVLSWQLWNETDSTEIGVITDSVAGDNKRQQATFAMSLSGVKEVRVRVKSTTGSDDPVYYGSSVRVVRS